MLLKLSGSFIMKNIYEVAETTEKPVTSGMFQRLANTDTGSGQKQYGSYKKP